MLIMERVHNLPKKLPAWRKAVSKIHKELLTSFMLCNKGSTNQDVLLFATLRYVRLNQIASNGLAEVYSAAYVVHIVIYSICLRKRPTEKKSALSICLCEYGIANKTNPILCNRVRDIDFPLLVS